MKLFRIPLAVIHAAAASRPAGYVDDVLSAGTVENDRLVLSEDAYAALLKRYSGRTIAQAVASSKKSYRQTGGPGTELKALLRDWLGIEATPGCSCNRMAERMDRLGPDWCEGEGMPEILGVMRVEHGKRWNAGKTILPWSDTAARALIRLACHRARAKAAS